MWSIHCTAQDFPDFLTQLHRVKLWKFQSTRMLLIVFVLMKRRISDIRQIVLRIKESQLHLHPYLNYDKQKRIKPLDIVRKQSNKVDKNAFWRKTGSTPKGQSEFIETLVAYRLNCAFNKRIVFPWTFIWYAHFVVLLLWIFRVSNYNNRDWWANIVQQRKTDCLKWWSHYNLNLIRICRCRDNRYSLVQFLISHKYSIHSVHYWLSAIIVPSIL